MMALLSLLASLLLSPMAQALTPQEVVSSMPATSELLVHALKLSDSSRYYGSAVLFRADEGQAYFVTNAHVVPEEGKRKGWRMVGPLTAKAPAPVRLIGQSIGHDLAVIAVALRDLDRSALVAMQQQVLPKAFRMEPLSPRSDLVFAFGGVPDQRVGETRDLLQLSSLGWSEELEVLEGVNAEQRKVLLEAIRQNRTKRLAGVAIHEIRDCPAYFLESCYLAKLRSWGFSGGVFLAGGDKVETVPWQIVGIVSHFSFLTNDTFVIPMRAALEVAGEILRRRNSITIDSNGRFQAISGQELKVLKGPLAGKIVRARSASTGGGGDQAGGGGDQAGGGGNGAAIKGLETFIVYLPGVRIGEGEEIHSIEGEERLVKVESLSDFVRHYDPTRTQRFSSAFPPTALPVLASSSYGERGIAIRWDQFNNWVHGSVVSTVFARHGAPLLISTTRKRDASDVWTEVDTMEEWDLSGVHLQQVGWDRFVAEAELESAVTVKRRGQSLDGGPRRRHAIRIVLSASDDGETHWLRIVRRLHDGTNEALSVAVVFR